MQLVCHRKDESLDIAHIFGAKHMLTIKYKIFSKQNVGIQIAHKKFRPLN
jgi:hypothetical protein